MTALFLSHAARDEATRTLLPTAEVLRARGVLELGAGTGLAGLAAAAALHCDVTLTDLPETLNALAANVARNPALAPRCRVTPLDWTRLDAASLASARNAAAPPALLLACDCVWLLALVAPFVAALDALAAHDAVILLVHQSRSAAVDAALWQALSTAHLLPPLPLGVDPVPLPQPPGAEAAAARIYLLRRQGRSDANS